MTRTGSQITRRWCLTSIVAAAGIHASAPASGQSRALAGELSFKRRIICLNREPTETLLALGITPIGVAETSAYRLWVSEQPLPSGIVDVGLEPTPNLELLQQLRPELIVVTQGFPHNELSLQKIAPVFRFVIYTPKGAPLQHAQDATRHLARILGIEDRARAFLADTDFSIATARDRLVSTERRPLYMISFISERHVLLFGRKSLFQDVLDRMEIANAWDGATNSWGFAVAGIEELARNPNARLVVLGHANDRFRTSIEQNPIWRGLPVVRAGRAFSLPPVWMFGSVPSAVRFSMLLAAALLQNARG